MSLQHVALEVLPAGLDDELAFWALLGWPRVEPPPGLGDRAAWVARGDQEIHLFLRDAPVVPPAGHVALVLGDALPGVLAALRDAGHELDERERHWGAERWFASSPGGHRVELMASPPTAARSPSA